MVFQGDQSVGQLAWGVCEREEVSVADDPRGIIFLAMLGLKFGRTSEVLEDAAPVPASPPPSLFPPWRTSEGRPLPVITALLVILLFTSHRSRKSKKAAASDEGGGRRQKEASSQWERLAYR